MVAAVARVVDDTLRIRPVLPGVVQQAGRTRDRLLDAMSEVVHAQSPKDTLDVFHGGHFHAV